MRERHHAVPVATNLSVETFVRRHVLARQPVVIKGALDAWNALRWTPASLAARVGSRPVCYRTEGAPATAPFGDLVARIFDDPGDAPAPYLRNIDIAEQLPELAGDVRPEPVYARDNWRSHALMPRRWPAAVKKGTYELFVSRAAAAFPYLHIDYWGMSAFFAQVYGDKEVILFPPDDAPYLAATPGDPLVSTLTDFDRVDPRARQHRVTIGPGDLLFNPGWWHTTRTTRSAITVIWAYWNRHEWAHLLAAVRAVGFTGRLVAPYLRFVGMCNRYGERRRRHPSP